MCRSLIRAARNSSGPDRTDGLAAAVSPAVLLPSRFIPFTRKMRIGFMGAKPAIHSGIICVLCVHLRLNAFGSVRLSASSDGLDPAFAGYRWLLRCNGTWDSKEASKNNTDLHGFWHGLHGSEFFALRAVPLGGCAKRTKTLSVKSVP
jgi:hypothetical protein